MKEPKKRRGGKLLGSFFVTYFVVLILPIMLGILCYREALNIVQRDIENENLAILTQASEIIDTRVEIMRNIGTQLVSSSQVVTLRYESAPFTYPNTTRVIDMRDSMPKYTAFNDFVFDYLLFFNNGRFVMNDQSIYSYEDFYQLYMREPDKPYEAWLEEMLAAPAMFGECRARTVQYIRGSVNNPEDINLIEFAYSFFPYDYSDGRAVLYVREEVLLDLISRVDLSGGGSVYIENNHGELLAYDSAGSADIQALQASLTEIAGAETSARIEIDGVDMFVTQVTSGATGFRLVAAQPATVVFARLTSLQRIIILAFAAAFLLGALVCYYLSKRNTSFMRSIAKDHSDQLLDMTYGNAFRSLQLSFSDIQGANEAMMETLDHQKPYMQYTFLSRLLNGDFRSEEEAVVMAKTIEAPGLGHEMCVVLFRIHSDGPASDTLTFQFAANCKAVIKLAIDSRDDRPLYIDKSEEEFVLLLTGEDLHDRVGALARRIRTQLPQGINEMLYVYVGNTVNRLTDVVRSYDNAVSLMYVKPTPDETPVVFYDTADKPTYALFYPQDMQHHLVNCTMSGDEEGILNLLNALKERNFTEGKLPSFMRQLFIDNLLSTLLQATMLSGLPAEDTESICEQIKELMSMPLNAQIQQTDNLFLLLCRAVQRQKSGTQKNMVESVMAYINANYADSDLSLTHVADRFGVSESYLSYAFKMHSGSNFFSFIENARMTKAKELLQQTNLKIGEIAAQVGYASANSFCRAFKRYTGDNASAYRNSAE